ncbi:hypothetical protein BDR07DRAFT_1437625, partial [Suillus spraguei]
WCNQDRLNFKHILQGKPNSSWGSQLCWTTIQTMILRNSPMMMTFVMTIYLILMHCS